MTRNRVFIIVIIATLAATLIWCGIGQNSRNIQETPATTPAEVAPPAGEISPSAEDSMPKPVYPEPSEERLSLNAELQKFDDALVDYCTAEKKQNTGKIDWLHHVSLKSELSAEQKKRNSALWEQFLALVKHVSPRNGEPPFERRYNYYILLFDVPSFSPDEETQKCLPQPTEMDKRAFAYLNELNGFDWFAAKLRYATHNDDDPDPSAYLPKRLKASFEAYKNTPNKCHPSRGIAHLSGYFENRRDDFGGESVKAIQEFYGDMQGKDFADIGSGCGFTLGLFRECIGPKAKLYATELDDYTLDVLRFTSQGLNVKVIKCKIDDCCLGEEQFDIINMTGVHLSAMVTFKEELIQNETIPWLRTISRALRPHGVMVVNDGDWGLVERGYLERVEEAGFKMLGHRTGPELSTYTYVYETVK